MGTGFRHRAAPEPVSEPPLSFFKAMDREEVTVNVEFLSAKVRSQLRPFSGAGVSPPPGVVWGSNGNPVPSSPGPTALP